MVEHQVPFGMIESPRIEDDHPLLIEHTEPHAGSSSPAGLGPRAGCRSAGHRTSQRVRPLASIQLRSESCDGDQPGSQLSARDDRTGAHQCAACVWRRVEFVGISTSIMNERPAVHREDSLPWRPTPDGIFIMTFGEDPMDRPDEPFVIAEGFTATRLADDKWWTASFRIASKTVTTTEMTRRLGLSPSSAKDLHRSVWVRHSVLPSTEPLERHLVELLDVLEPIATTLTELQQEGCHTDFFVGFGSETGSAGSGGADLDAALLLRIAALETDLGLDLYPPQA